MRNVALIVITTLIAAGSIALAARGSAASKPGLSEALAKTAQVPSLRYALHVRITKSGTPLTLHVRGQSDARTISIRLATSGVSGGEMLDGPFLYEQAPEGIVVFGKVRWLRVALTRLPPRSDALTVLHALTPTPLLRIVGKGRLAASSGGAVYRGPVAYDDPVVRDGLSRLTGGMEFRGLRLTVHVTKAGLIDRLAVRGKTADGSSTLELKARLYAFGRPVHVTPPKPGTFMDEQLPQLSE